MPETKTTPWLRDLNTFRCLKEKGMGRRITVQMVLGAMTQQNPATAFDVEKAIFGPPKGAPIERIERVREAMDEMVQFGYLAKKDKGFTEEYWIPGPWFAIAEKEAW